MELAPSGPALPVAYDLLKFSIINVKLAFVEPRAVLWHKKGNRQKLDISRETVRSFSRSFSKAVYCYGRALESMHRRGSSSSRYK